MGTTLVCWDGFWGLPLPQKALRNLSQLGWLGYLGREVGKLVVFLRASHLAGLSPARVRKQNKYCCQQ